MNIPDASYYEPPAQDHFAACEDADSLYYYCESCSELYRQDEGINRCDSCKLFIPKVKDCICEYIQERL